MKKPIQHLPSDVIMCGKILTNICEEELGIAGHSLRSKGRYHYLVATRAACYFLLHTINEFRVTDIAAYFNRDHASVIHGLTTHQDLYLTDHKGYRDTFRQLEQAYKFKLSDLNPSDGDNVLNQVMKIERMIRDLEETKKFLMTICVTNNEMQEI